MERRRHITPPSNVILYDSQGVQCSLGSASTTTSYFSIDHDWSPASNSTAASSPPKSPHRTVKDCGPLLLPRVRVQDQIPNSVTPTHVYHGHNRTASLPAAELRPQSGRHLQRPSPQIWTHYSVSSGGMALAPLPPASPLDHMINDKASMTRKTHVNHGRSTSASAPRSHSRSTSSSSIDASTLSRYGYPTYRQSPVPQIVGRNAHHTRMTSALNHLAPIPLSNVQPQPRHISRSRSNSPPPPPPPASAPAAVTCNPVYEPRPQDMSTSTALEYLTSPNPTPYLTKHVVEPPRGQNTHFWFDVRNVRPWVDFNVSTIAAIPDLLKLLRCPVLTERLPTPNRVNLNPERVTHLAEICASHHAVKVNAVLKITQGSEKHIAMRALNPAAGARQQPEFISNYQSDTERTIYGDNRGRVVGIVKCYEQWNSGMRSGGPPDQVKYLHGLSHLHRFMREHGTRYGFIMTEIELVCVRAGGPASPTNIPNFGYLELAAPVDVSTFGPDENANIRMTVGLALWWLHMLAKENPMPNQFHWHMEVGPPSAQTRHRHQNRDDWMPKAIGSDTREAKRVRGWVWPNEPLSKREVGKAKRAKARK